MPRTIKRGAGARMGGIETFLNLKKVFDDAMRKRQWEAEKLTYSAGEAETTAKIAEKGAMSRTMIGAGYRPTDIGGLLAGGGTDWQKPSLEPKDIGKGFVEIGGKPYKKPFDRTDVILSKAMSQARQLAKKWTGQTSESKFKKIWPGIAKKFKLPKEYWDAGWAWGHSDTGGEAETELINAIEQLQQEIEALQ